MPYALQDNDTLNDDHNPLDNIEDILCNNNWTFERLSQDELTVKLEGQFCEYRLYFIWQEELGAMQFCAQYDMHIHSNNMDEAAATLMEINENLWMGHFDIPKRTRKPSYRYTCLMQTTEGAQDQLENLVDISLTQCEKYFHAFHILADENAPCERQLPLALMETQGVS